MMTSIIWKSAHAVHLEPRIESLPKFLLTPPTRARVGSFSQCSPETIFSNRKHRGILRIRFLSESLDMRSLMATIGAAKACVATSTGQHSPRLCGRFIPFGKLNLCINKLRSEVPGRLQKSPWLSSRSLASTLISQEVAERAADRPASSSDTSDEADTSVSEWTSANQHHRHECDRGDGTWPRG